MWDNWNYWSKTQGESLVLLGWILIVELSKQLNIPVAVFREVKGGSVRMMLDWGKGWSSPWYFASVLPSSPVPCPCMFCGCWAEGLARCTSFLATSRVILGTQCKRSSIYKCFRMPIVSSYVTLWETDEHTAQPACAVTWRCLTSPPCPKAVRSVCFGSGLVTRNSTFNARCFSTRWSFLTSQLKIIMQVMFSSTSQ